MPVSRSRDGRYWSRLQAAIAGTFAALVILTAAAPAAHAYVYAASRAGGSGTSIERANLDGTGAAPSFISGASGPVGRRGGRSAHLLGEHVRVWNDRASEPRRQRDQPELHHGCKLPVWGCRGRSAYLLGQQRQRLDRSGQPRRQQRQPEFHHRCAITRAALPSTVPSSTGQMRGTVRRPAPAPISAAPISMGPARSTHLSPAWPRPWALRSMPPASTGAITTRTRSAGRTSMEPA